MYKKNKSKTSDFVCIVGLDGCGKSTVIKALTKQYDYTVSHWKSFKESTYLPFISKSRNPGVIIKKLGQYSRALYIEKLIALQLEHIIMPALEQQLRVLADSYYFKFYAKEKVYNKCPTDFFEWLDRLPIPKLTIFLDIDPELAFKRKERLTRYEFLKRPNRRDFVNFQSKVRENIFEILKNKPYQIVDASKNKEAVLSFVLDCLKNHDYI